MNILKTNFFASLTTISLLATNAIAQNVTLESPDGNFTLSGELMRFENGTYFLKTSVGEFQLDAAKLKCKGAACPGKVVQMTDFTISGSTSLNKTIMPLLISSFGSYLGGGSDVAFDSKSFNIALSNKDGDKANVKLNLGGSTSGLRDLTSQKANFAITTRPARANEQSAFAAAGLGDITAADHERVFALDALVMVTSPNNPVRSISEEDIARVFSGEITNWSQLGGRNEPITLYVRPENTGTGSVFSQLVMSPRRLKIAPDATEVETDEAISAAVLRDAGGIGFTSFSNASRAKKLSLRGPCGILTPANEFTIKTEEYPLARRLFIYNTDKDMPGLGKEFMTYLQSENAQKIIADMGFVDQAVSNIALNEQGLRFASSVLPSNEEFNLPTYQNMVQEFLTAYRTSITFRFEQGSTQLDTRAQGDVRRLASRISSGALAGKEIMLIGFTDSVGQGALNQNLSIQRAEQVKQALLAALPAKAAEGQKITVQGYGELSPLSCNDTLSGRQINRRVEVWTRDISAQ